MRDRAPKSDPLGRHKEQAERLREFLSGAGIELKHTHALEAVARMHGFRNYHLLHSACDEGDQTWLISTITSGLLPISHLAKSIPDGVAIFCHQLARVAAASEEVELEVRAQESGPNVGLYALNYGALVVTLTRPPTPRLAAHEDLRSFEELSFVDVARALHDAVYERSGWDRFRERVNDEGFLDELSRGIDVEVLKGASLRSDTWDADERVVLASRYLMGVAFSERSSR